MKVAFSVNLLKQCAKAMTAIALQHFRKNDGLVVDRMAMVWGNIVGPASLTSTD